MSDSVWSCETANHVMDKANVRWVRSNVKFKGQWQNKPVPICTSCEREGQDGRPGWARG